jgi:hypothetical protein
MTHNAEQVDPRAQYFFDMRLSLLPWLALCLGFVSSAPRRKPQELLATTTYTYPPVTTAGYASNDPNPPNWSLQTDPKQMTDPSSVQPQRGSLGGNIDGPQNIPLQYESPDLLAPPTTDAGTVGNAKWSMSLSHNRLQTGGWARQQNSESRISTMQSSP